MGMVFHDWFSRISEVGLFDKDYIKDLIDIVDEAYPADQFIEFFGSMRDFSISRCLAQVKNIQHRTIFAEVVDAKVAQIK